jgi:hypothetical protein
VPPPEEAVFKIQALDFKKVSIKKAEKKVPLGAIK